jgi:hypothetical protein
MEVLEQRTVFDAAPIADGFWRPGGPQTFGVSPRLPGVATYVDGVPTFTVSYEQMKAALVASDPDNDQLYFLYRGAPMLLQLLNGTVVEQDNALMGLVDAQGDLIPFTPPAGAIPGAAYDTNSDGVPDGPLVLEPGETWTWRGPRYQPFTGANQGPNTGEATTAPDAAMSIAVMDRIREWAQAPSGFALISGNLSPVVDAAALAGRPQPLGAPWILDVGHNTTVTWTYEQIRAASPVTDPEGNSIFFLVQPQLGFFNSGILKVNGVSLNDLPRTGDGQLFVPLDRDIGAGSPFLLGPGGTISFEPTALAMQQLFAVLPWDQIGASNRTESLMFGARTTQNSVPTALASVDLGELGLTKRRTFTGAELIGLMQLNDADGDATRLVVQWMSAAGSLLVNGQALKAPGVILATDTVEFVSPGFIAGETGFILAASDAFTSDGSVATTRFAFSSAAFAYDGALGDTTVIAGGRVLQSAGDSISAAVWRNPAGQLIVSYEMRLGTDQPAFQRVNLSTRFGLAALTGDPVLATVGAQVYIFAPTADGLVFVDLGTTTAGAVVPVIRNVSASYPDAPVSGLVISATPFTRGMVLGYSPSGELTGVMPFMNRLKNFDLVNITDKLAERSLTVPTLVGDSMAYETVWNGQNIAGVDAGGSLWSIWSPTITVALDAFQNSSLVGDWFVDNLSTITGVGSLSGGLSVYLTSWSGINIAGLNGAGELVVTWWVPEFGGNWANTNFTQLFGGPMLRAGSISAYTTSWSALNIVGVDAQGQAHAYWWEPTRAGDPLTDVWSVDPLGTPGFDPDTRLSASGQTQYSELNRLSIFGVTPAHEVRAIYWMPGFGDQWQELAV